MQKWSLPFKTASFLICLMGICSHSMGEVKLNPDAAFPVASIDKKSEKEARALPSREIRFSFAEVVKKVSGAVVNVYCSKKIKASSPQQELLRDFFGDAFSTLPLPPRVQQSLGSGVILREDGLVVTNNHVIDGANKIRIVTEDETEYDATVIVRDPRVDLAILKISGKNLPFINLVSMKDLQVGDLVCAVGNPFGLGQTVTMGCISALARDGFLSNDPRVFIQTDAAINRGNSGGALVTTDAKLAGINAFIFSKSGGSIGLSFAIPSDFLLSLLQAADNDGHVKRPWIGASYHSTSQEIADMYGLKKPYGIIVAEVYPDSPAEKASLKEGDVITHIDDQPVTNDAYFRFIINTSITGRQISLTLMNQSKETRTVDLTLSPPPESKEKPIRLNGRVPLAGVSAGELSPALADRFNLEYQKGRIIITDVQAESAGYQLGFRKGDLLEEINDVPLKTLTDVRRSLKRSYFGWFITFSRSGTRQQLRIR